jgi:hypothetical protein
MIRHKRKEARSDELPIAKLHLDEVRDILQILATPDSDDNDSDVHTKFIVRDQECDTLEELEKIGGVARQFEMIVENGRRESVLKMSAPFTYLRLSCPEQDFWVKQGKIRQIFDANTIWWKNTFVEALNRMPPWLAVVLFVGSILPYYLIPSWRSVHRDGTYWTSFILFTVFLGWLMFSFGGSVVILRYSHAGGIRRWFQDHATQMMLVVLGVVLKELGDWIFHYFQH